MKVNELHINFLSLWQIFICLLIFNSSQANVAFFGITTKYFESQKLATNDFNDTSKPLGNEFPIDSADENNLNTIDFEEISEVCLLNKFTAFFHFTSNGALVIINYKESNNIPYFLDIVPPPPKC